MISGSVRFLVNVESLNGVESVGNLTRHRTAPIVTKTGGEYVIRYVPVISGESIAHAYQMALVDMADKLKLPVTARTRQGELIKFSDDDMLEAEGISPPKKEGKTLNDARRFEVDVMLKDLVADVGGFMYAGGNPVRRSSKFSVGYMIPVLGNGDIPAQLEAQFHVRYSSSKMENQAIFNVEVGSALYTLSFMLDEEKVAVPSNPGPQVEGEKRLQEQKMNRVEAAIKSLYTVLTGNFGGKRSRFLPSMELKSAVVTVTDFPFITEPGHSNDYISLTGDRVKKAKDVLGGKRVLTYAIDREGLNLGSAERISDPEDMIRRLLEEAKKSLENVK
ncbi:type I-A CRISPR-associated protein Cas7/Csa2 [Metallosphaera cuprina]|uniref:CRISPR-associated autoregulator DevR family protein protein n=1 Tax=Metallosphaera cuprina (strain Ar-4) TaxID=1006006 RepID=F4G358_METCR|nr:type I-A CRISPR-associated protein Cas7/Csa2 [Metallosphaera cuprina]AEB95256.1 CRISPR-associated autoregulator DevR family protein protein [Metallosphaera cuprina Ar-4]